MRALYGLASHLGCTVGYLMHSMSAQEFQRWLAWFEQRSRPQPSAQMRDWFELEE